MNRYETHLANKFRGNVARAIANGAAIDPITDGELRIVVDCYIGFESPMARRHDRPADEVRFAYVGAGFVVHNRSAFTVEGVRKFASLVAKKRGTVQHLDGPTSRFLALGEVERALALGLAGDALNAAYVDGTFRK